MCCSPRKGKCSQGTEGAGLKKRCSAREFHRGVPERRGRGGEARVACREHLRLGRCGVPRSGAPSRLRKPAASLARGLGKSLPRPTGSAWQLGVTAAAAGSKCTEGPPGWRRLAGERRGGRVRSLQDAASPPVSASLRRGARPLSPSGSLSNWAIS